MGKASGSGYGLGMGQFMSHRVYVPEDQLARARVIAEDGDV